MPDLKPVTVEIASRKRRDPTAGWLEDYENPEPLVRQGIYPYEAFDRVYRDPEVATHWGTRTLALLSKPHEIVPSVEDDSAAETIAQFVRTALAKNQRWHNVREELLDAIMYGFQIAEIMWKPEGGRVWIDSIKGRPHQHFKFDNDLRLKFFPQGDSVGELVPERKFVYAVFRPRRDNPYGNGLGGLLSWPVWLQKNVTKMALTFCDRFGSPTARITVPDGTSEEQVQEGLKVIDAIQNESGFVIPEWIKADLLEAQRSPTVNVYDFLIRLFDSQKVKLILGQTLTSDTTGTGSYALGQVHNQVREDILQADGNWLDDTINDSIIRWLVDFNFGSDAPAPLYRTITKPSDDLKAMMDVDEKFARLAPIPLKDLYGRYGLREPDPGEPTTTSHSSPTPPGLQGAGVVAFAEPARFNRILELEAATLDRAPRMFVKAIADVKKNSPVPAIGATSARHSIARRQHR